MTEQVNDHQRRPRRPVEVEPLTLFSSDDVKQRIGFDRLKAEAEGWGKLMKDTLGSLDNPEDEQRYYQTMEEILREIVNQLVSILNKPGDSDRLLARLEGGALTLMFDDILARWDEIRNVSSYVAASLKNLLRI